MYLQRNNRGIQLLRKGQTGLVRAIFSRLGLMAVLVLIQFAIPILVFLYFEEYVSWLYSVMLIFTFVMTLVLLNSSLDPSAKITWLVFLTMVPVLGAFFFWYTRSNVGHRLLRKQLNQMQKKTRNKLTTARELSETLTEDAAPMEALSRYLSRTGCYPVYHNTQVTYLPSGEATFEAMLREVEKAEHFIFLEFFVVAEGVMWGKLLEILARKAAAGVEVCLLYDGTCEFTTLCRDYPKRLKRLGIKAKVFAPITPFVSTHYNYRDHRKILVIDGHTAFTGGVNLADEYINVHRRFGHWKDAAIELQGEAVRRFTLMFLEMWCLHEKKPDIDSYLAFPATPPQSENATPRGYVLPYADSPLDHEKAGERVYMDLLNRAKKSVSIMTPYLILDSELETAIKFCAERGVKVTLILPGIPDKKFPNALAKTHYASLLQSGVRIFEYLPGFVHSKVFLVDSEEAVVGTINLDYRSLYHHFECAAYLYKTDCLAAIAEDFEKTLPLCREITEENRKKGTRRARLIGCLFKWLAPLV